MEEKSKVKVVVKYPAAEKPFEDKLDKKVTVGELMTLVLKYFGLSEGSSQGGSVMTYTLYYENKALDNANETLGQLAGEKEALEMKLSQHITQGKID